MANKAPPQTLKILRRPALIQKVGLKDTQIDELEAIDRFPKRVQISSRAVGWIEHEVDAWIAQRMAARREQASSTPTTSAA